MAGDVDKSKVKFLLVDDDPRSIQLIEALLRQEGYGQIKSTNNPRQARALFETMRPDLVVLDLQMPHMDGFAVMRELTPLIPPDDYVPIMVITGELNAESKHKALAEGGKDFLNKPIDAVEAMLRVRNQLEIRSLHRQVRQHNEHLEAQVRLRTKALDQAQVEILHRLALAAEFRDDVTGEHTWRVGRLSALLAHSIGWPEDQIELIRRAAPLHDVGKIAVPDRVLLKPGVFTQEDREEMKAHTKIGSKLLSGSSAPLLRMANVIALTHHERWDGDGYLKMKAEQIPLPGRIVALADVFDALTHKRPYKEAWPLERAREEIDNQSGKQFDPGLVEAFIQIIDREGDTLLHGPKPQPHAA